MKHNDNSITCRKVRINDLELHIAETGDADAPLLILLHGFPDFWFAWRDYMTELADAGFHVVAPDQRGYNLSDKPRSIGHYKLDILADDIVGLASVLGVQTFHVVGHDWGGSVAWSIASRHPRQLGRMAVLNAPHPAVWLRNMRGDSEQRRISRYVRYLQLPWLPEEALRLGGYHGLSGAFAELPPESFTKEVLDSYREAWSVPGALTAMLNWYRALFRHPEPIPIPGSLSTPCLILWGDYDRFAVPKLADESATLCAEAEVVHLSGVGHWIIYEARDSVLFHLKRFLVENSASARGDQKIPIS